MLVRRYYGWQIVVVDVASVAVTLAGAAAESGGVGTLGVAGYFFAAPVVHFAHRNVGRGFASFGLRVGAPFLGGALGAALADCPEGGEQTWCGVGEVGVGILAGALGAMIVDAAVLAHEVEKKRPAAGMTWVPRLLVDRDRAAAAVAGQF